MITFAVCSTFFLLRAYYEGALTMFFAKPVVVPFSSITQALEAYPEWTFMYQTGVESEFTYHTMLDSAYENFWRRAQLRPEETSFDSIGYLFN